MSRKWPGGAPRLVARRLDRDALAAQHAVVVAQQPGLPAVRQAGRAHRGEGVLGVLGMGVEQGGEEHVPGHAAQRVEMQMDALPHAQAAGRYTGTT